MRALFVAPYLPTPGSGGRTRLINIMGRLRERYDLHLVAFHAPDQSAEDSPYPGMVLTPPPRRHRPGGLRGSVLFYRERLERLPAYAGYIATPRMHAAIAEQVRALRPHVVQFETTEMAQYLPAAGSGAVRTLDLQDVATRWFGRTAGAGQTRKQRALMALELAKTRRYEARAVRIPEAVYVSSSIEADAIRALAGVESIVVPNGVDTGSFVAQPAVAEEPDTLLFVGPLTYDANFDGLVWFAREVMPLIREARPSVTLDVVGTPVQVDLGPGVRLLGFADDVRPHLARAPVSIVPVRLGSGTRYKILEALSMQRCVVSTATGAEGLGVVHDEHLLIADDAPGFARAVLDALGDPQRRGRLGAAGRALVAERYDWGPLVERIAGSWEAAAAGRASTSHE